MPEAPFMTYRGRFEGGAVVADAGGRVVAQRSGGEGSGYVIGEVQARRSAPLHPVPDRYWLHRRGLVPAVAWSTQRVLGRRWYARHVRGRPALQVAAPHRLSSPESA
jgi:hypothetical protein